MGRSRKEKKPEASGEDAGGKAEKGSSSKSSTPKKQSSSSKHAAAPASDAPTEDLAYEKRSLADACGEDAAESLFSVMPSEVFVSFDQLQSMARGQNTQLPTPEFVLVGPTGAGKTAVLEAFLGEQIAAGGSATTRPVFYNVVHNSDVSGVKATVKRDVISKEADKEVSVADLGKEIASRSGTASDVPVIVTLEMPSTCNMTLIDTPGLDTTSERDEWALSLVRPNHRRVLAVESTADWGSMKNIDFVKKFDPELARTVFVYTNFQNHLQTFTNTREVNKFLAGIIPDTKTYFTTVPSAGIRAELADRDAYRVKVAQAAARDVNTLEQLQFDKRHEGSVGVGPLRKHLLALAWKSYQDAVPAVLKELRVQKSNFASESAALEAELKALDSSKLRSLASNHVVDFLQVLDSLITGTSVGNPSVNGQTLDEEKNAHGEGDWVDMYNRVIRCEAEEWGIPYHNTKVYGGQQFERLLAEFNAVAQRRVMEDVTMHNVATSAGINKLNNVPNFAWAAADLAQQKSQDAFLPLIEQLTNRAIYIIKRLTEISEKIIDQRRKERAGSSASALVEDVSAYPYFTYHVKDVFYKFVDGAAKTCREKCLDEFYSTRTIYWDITESNLQGDLPQDRGDAANSQAAVDKLSTSAFEKIRERITTNVLLKFYNFFLVPVQSELATVLQGSVNTLSDEQLEQLFDTAATKSRLEGALEKVEKQADQLGELDKIFLEHANTFSHPVKSLSE